MSKQREQFEAWCRSPDGVLPPDALPIEWDDEGLEPFVYKNDGTTGRIHLECEWAAWQASRVAALEEAAALICHDGLDESDENPWAYQCRRNAAAIRALAQKEGA